METNLKPGITYGDSWNQYLEVPAMNGSTLVHGLTSMKALRHAIENEVEETPAMMLGTTTHVLLLEPLRFKRQFVVMPPFHTDPENLRKRKNKSETDEQRRTKSKLTNYYQTKAAQFYRDAEHDGLTVVESDFYSMALEMIDAIRAQRSATLWIDAEQSRFEATVIGEIAGILCKGRIDILHPNCIVDLKTSREITMTGFGKSAWDRHYPMKQAIHRELVRHLTGEVVPVRYIVQQNSAPWDCWVTKAVPDAVLDQELEKAKRLLDKYGRCLELNDWPGIDGGNDYVDFYTPDYRMETNQLDWSGVDEG